MCLSRYKLSAEKLYRADFISFKCISWIERFYKNIATRAIEAVYPKCIWLITALDNAAPTSCSLFCFFFIYFIFYFFYFF